MQRIITIALVLIFIAASLSAQVLITEFMADPQDPLESEWVEIYNFLDYAVDLTGWSLCDLVGCSEIGSALVDPGNYLILCQDSSAFVLFYPAFEGKIIEVSSWRALNNSGDLIHLLNPDSMTADSVEYDSGNGDNISWERISFDNPGWDSTNWHPSLDQSGSTPGMQNSVYGGFPTGFSMELGNKLISPGCGCEHEYLNLTIDMPRDCHLTLAVYSLEGRKLHTIFDGQMLASGEYLYDGRVSDGSMLKLGMYILRADLSGECSYSEKYVFGVVK